ncbi:hypothetical protein KAR91_25715 [Candidatus Pacearchaeota archaeon]|nr:hypothetical protein [Candidatus Pacearchaeota archaeon]
MKAKIISVEFKKEYTTKFGVLYLHKITYGEGDSGFYSSKKKEQTKFVVGQETEFDIEKQMGQNNKSWDKIKPIMANQGFSNQGRAQQREQNKYSGFAMAYAKDLVVSGKIEIEQMYAEAQCMIDWMVLKDKELLK